MLTHDFAKKTKKIERERENNEKTMLYIFRYFKEIQKGIFVIKTMFETVLFGLIYVVLNLVRTFYTFSFFVPFLFGAILKQQVALLYQSSPASLLLSLLQKEFWFAHMCCVFCFFFGGGFCPSVASLPDETKHRSLLSEAILTLSDKTHLIQLVVWLFEVIRCVKRGTDRKKPSPVEGSVTPMSRIAWWQYAANWALL